MKADADYWKGFWAGRAIAVRLASLGVDAISDWYLYNGVRLPKLPEWDKSVYPYAVIRKSSDLYYLQLFTSPVYLVRRTLLYVLVADNVCSSITYCYDATGTSGGYYPSWGRRIDDDRTNIAAGETIYAESPNVWANFDLLKDDGSIYIVASAPVPYKEDDSGAVAYLYNGVRLPKLPEWDKEAYPYATLGYNNAGDTITLGITSNVLKFYDIADYASVAPALGYGYDADGDSWLRLSSPLTGTAYSIWNPFWTNYDMLDSETSEVHIAASVPIPTT